MEKDKRAILLLFTLMVSVLLAVGGGYYLTPAVGTDVYGGGQDSTGSQVYHEPSPTDTEPPAPPTGLTVSDPGTGDYLDLYWNANAEEDLLGYRIYRAVSAATYAPTEDAYRRIGGGTGMVDTTTPQYRDDTVSQDVYYFYRVTAVDHSGNESLPSVPAATFATDFTPPATPHGFKVIELDTGQDVELSWQANTEPDLAGYHLYRATEPGGPFRLTKIIGRQQTSVYETGLTQGQWYYYYLIAVDEKGNGSSPTPVLSVRPRQAVRVEFNAPDAQMPAHIFILPEYMALFLNLPGDRISVKARAVDDRGRPVPLAGTIRFAAAFGRFEDASVTGGCSAAATFTAAQTGEGEIAVEYFPAGAEEPVLVDATEVRALEWYISLSASGDRTTTDASDISLEVEVTDQNGRPVTDWQAEVLFKTVASPEPAAKAKGKRRQGRWHARAHANIVKEGRASGVASGRPDEDGKVGARWVASTTPGKTRVRALLYYDELRGAAPKLVAKSNTCTVKVEPGPARYIGFDLAEIQPNSKTQKVTVCAFDAFGNRTDDYGDLKVWVQAPTVAAAFSTDGGRSWQEHDVWVEVKPGDRLKVRLTGEELPDDRCILTTRVEGLSPDPPPGVAQINLPLRVAETGRKK